MAVVTPLGVQAEGNVGVWFVPGGVADRSAPAMVADDLANVAIALQGYIKGGQFQTTSTQNKGEDRRLSSREVPEVLGRVTRGIDTIQYVYNPQELGTPGHADNAAYEALVEGATGDFIVRYGEDAETDLAAGDVVDVIPGEAGARRKNAPAENDEFAKLTVSQDIGVGLGTESDAVILA